MKPASSPLLAAISTLPVIVACTLLGATQAGAATCMENPIDCQPYVVTINQVGPNVVATGSGEFDLTGLTLRGPVTLAASVDPAASAVGLANGPGNLFASVGPVTGPSNFGTGGIQNAGNNNNDGPVVGLVGLPSVPSLDLIVPSPYPSGELLGPSEITFANTTLGMLGITPGIYKWTWGGATFRDQSYTIDVATPLPATLPLFASGLGALGLLGWRRKRKARAVA